MFFLIRTAFWISLLLLALPFGAELKSDGPNAQDRASIDGMAALAAAGATISDVTGFCQRQPGACDVGSQALKMVGERAMVGAAKVSDYLSKDAPRAVSTAPATTAAVPAASRGTLTASDRKPAWRGPAA